MEKERILIVDADDYIHKALNKCLEDKYEISKTASLSRALKIFKETPINMVITEIKTPKTKGIEVLRKLKEEKSDIPIIVVTTHKSVLLAVEAMKAGAYDYITKPFNEEELKLVVLHALEWKKLVEEAKEKKIYRELALFDGLTQIYNRRYFEELLKREIERASRYPQKFSLLMIDIDDFKRYNDTYGHLAGDKALKWIAQILLQKTRETDLVARYGGEEFVIIAPYTAKKGASVIAERLVDLVAKEDFGSDDPPITKVTVSIGIATFSDDATEKEDLIQRADKALYQAKKSGKNRACISGLDA